MNLPAYWQRRSSSRRVRLPSHARQAGSLIFIIMASQAGDYFLLDPQNAIGSAELKTPSGSQRFFKLYYRKMLSP
jgi:hypothetical protein